MADIGVNVQDASNFLLDPVELGFLHDLLDFSLVGLELVVLAKLVEVELFGHHTTHKVHHLVGLDIRQQLVTRQIQTDLEGALPVLFDDLLSMTFQLVHGVINQSLL